MPLDIELIKRDVQAGLLSAQARMDDATETAGYYELLGNAYLQKWGFESIQDFEGRPKQCSAFTRGVIDVLARDLWSPAPVRQFENKVASAWLEQVYQQNTIDARLTAAEVDALLGGAAAIQVYPTGNPEVPIKIWIFGAEEYEVYAADDDPCLPLAICTRNRWGINQWKYEIWTADRYIRYETKPVASIESLAAYRPLADLVVDRENPFGIIPFVFHHCAPPVKTFWGRAIGNELRRTNAVIDEHLTVLAQLCSGWGLPQGFSTGVALGTQLSPRPGTFTDLPPISNDPDSRLGEPKIDLVEASMHQVAAIWEHIRSSAEMKMQELQIPVSVVYGDSSTDLSGVAVIAKALPLSSRTKKRQGQLVETEQRLAKMVLHISGLHYGVPALLDAADDPGLTVDWAEPQAPLPTLDRLTQDEKELELGLKSKVELIMERRGLTRSQAVETIRQIILDQQTVNSLEEELGAEEAPAPTGLPAPAANGEVPAALDRNPGDPEPEEVYA